MSKSKIKENATPLVPDNYDLVAYGTSVRLPDGKVVTWRCDGHETASGIQRFFGGSVPLPLKVGDKIRWEGQRWEVVGFDGNYAGHGLVEFVHLKKLSSNERPRLHCNLGLVVHTCEILPPAETSGMVPVHEFAARWGISEKDVRKLLRAGELTGVKDGKEWLVDANGIEIEVSQ